MTGDILPFQIIYKGKTARSHPKTNLPSDWHITHSANHWSNEDTTLQYLKEIIIPHVQRMRDDVGDSAALLIQDNFKGQATKAVLDLLNEHNIHVCFLPPNSTDRLQPMDLSVNKAIKSYMKKEFEEWYAEQIMSQIDSSNDDDIEPIEYPLPVMRELGAKWLVGIHQHMCANPQIIVNGFVKSGITNAIDNAYASCSSPQDASVYPSDDDLCLPSPSTFLFLYNSDDEASILAYDTDIDDQ